MAGIYLHIPFCKRRCIYCDFFSTTQGGQTDRYIEALCSELEQRKEYLEGEDIETIYLGGGTPSQLQEKHFEPQDDMIKDIIYQERRFPLRTVQDIHGIYLVSSKELEESLIEGVRNLDAVANELLDGICLFCSTQELRYLTDAELIETIYAQ